MLKALLITTLAAILSVGCSEVVLTDVSHDPKYHDLVGSQYEIVGAVDAYGIRQHSKAPIEYVTLIPPPGIGGYEVGFRIPIERGTKLTVKKVMRTTRWFDCGIAFMVALDGTPIPVTADITLEINRGNKGDGCLELNPSIYNRLSRADSSAVMH